MNWRLVVVIALVTAGPAAAGPVPSFTIEDVEVAFRPGEPALGALTARPGSVQFDQALTSPVPDPNWTYGNGGAVSLDARFVATIRLTDAASGQSGTVDVGGLVHADWIIRWDGLSNPNGAGIEPDGAAKTLTLGKNTYTVGLVADSEMPGGAVVSAVEVAATPEPGTLALAALGLAPLAAFRRWAGRATWATGRIRQPEPVTS